MAATWQDSISWPAGTPFTETTCNNQFRDRVDFVRDQTRHPMGGRLDAFKNHTSYNPLVNGYHLTINGSGKATAYLEVNAVCMVSSAVNALVKLQYWTGAAWADVSGATLTLALSTADTVVYGISSAFTLTAGVSRYRGLFYGSVGSANPIAVEVWVIERT